MRAANLQKSPAVHLGRGVPKLEEPSEEPKPKEAAPDSYTDDKGRKYKLDKLGQANYANVASFKNQRSDPKMVKMDPPVAAVFNLSLPDDLERYNQVIAGTYPVSDPSIELLASDRQFHNGAFFVFLTYQNIWYLKPII